MRDAESYKKACDEVLLSRAKNTEVGTGFSAKDENGNEYTREHLRWQLTSHFKKVSARLTEEERRQWFIDNPEPTNKYI